MIVPRLSGTLYQALHADVDPRAFCPGRDPHAHVAAAIERTAQRLVSDRDTFRAPAKTLFDDIRFCFALGRQARVMKLVAAWVVAVDRHLAEQRSAGFDAAGNPLRCPVFTRQGRQCERAPRPHNGLCPSHQHLASVEPEQAPMQAA